MVNITIDYIKELFLESFEEQVNYYDEKLNEEIANQYIFSFPTEYYRNSDGELDIEDDPEVSCVKVDNVKVEDISFAVFSSNDGKVIIQGKADVVYNLTAMHRVFYSDGYDSDYDDFEMTDGSDEDEATISFVFTEEGVGFDSDLSLAEYECCFDII